MIPRPLLHHFRLLFLFVAAVVCLALSSAGISAISSATVVRVPVPSSYGLFDSYYFPDNFTDYATYAVLDKSKRYNFVFDGIGPLKQLLFNFPPQHHDFTVMNSRIARVAMLTEFHYNNITLLNNRLGSFHIDGETIFYRKEDVGRTNPLRIKNDVYLADVMFDIRNNVFGPVGVEFGYYNESATTTTAAATSPSISDEERRIIVDNLELAPMILFGADYARPRADLVGSEIIIEHNYFANQWRVGDAGHSFIVLSQCCRNKSAGADSGYYLHRTLFRISISHNIAAGTGLRKASFVAHENAATFTTDFLLINNNSITFTNSTGARAVTGLLHGLSHPTPGRIARAEVNNNNIVITQPDPVRYPSPCLRGKIDGICNTEFERGALYFHMLSDYFSAVWLRTTININHNTIAVNFSHYAHTMEAIFVNLRDGWWLNYSQFELNINNNIIMAAAINRTAGVNVLLRPHMEHGTVAISNNNIFLPSYLRGRLLAAQAAAAGIAPNYNTDWGNDVDARGIRVIVWGSRNVSFVFDHNNITIAGPGETTRGNGIFLERDELVRDLYTNHRVMQQTFLCCWHKNYMAISETRLVAMRNNRIVLERGACHPFCYGARIVLSWMFNITRLELSGNTIVIDVVAYTATQNIAKAPDIRGLQVAAYPETLQEIVIENNTLRSSLDAATEHANKIISAGAPLHAGIMLRFEVDLPVSANSVRKNIYIGENRFVWPNETWVQERRGQLWFAAWQLGNNSRLGLVRIRGNDVSIAGPHAGGHFYATTACIFVYFLVPINAMNVMLIEHNNFTLRDFATDPPIGLAAISILCATNNTFVNTVNISGNRVDVRGVVTKYTTTSLLHVGHQLASPDEFELVDQLSGKPKLKAVITNEFTVVEQLIIAHNHISFSPSSSSSSSAGSKLVGFAILNVVVDGHITVAGNGILVHANDIQAVFSSPFVSISDDYYQQSAFSSTPMPPCSAIVCVDTFSSFAIFNPAQLIKEGRTGLPDIDIDMRAEVYSKHSAFFLKRLTIRDMSFNSSAASASNGDGAPAPVAAFFPALHFGGRNVNMADSSFLVAIGDDQFTISSSLSVPSPLETVRFNTTYPSYFGTTTALQAREQRVPYPPRFFPSEVQRETALRMAQEDADRKRSASSVAPFPAAVTQNSFFEPEIAAAEEQKQLLIMMRQQHEQRQQQQQKRRNPVTESIPSAPFWNAQRAQSGGGALDDGEAPSCRVMSQARGVGRGIFIIDSNILLSDPAGRAKENDAPPPTSDDYATRAASFISLAYGNVSFHGQLCIENSSIVISSRRADRGFTFLEVVANAKAVPAPRYWPAYMSAPVWTVLVNSTLHITCDPTMKTGGGPVTSAATLEALPCGFSNSDSDLQRTLQLTFQDTGSKKFRFVPAIDGVCAAAAFNSRISVTASRTALRQSPHAQPLAGGAFSFPLLTQHPISRASPVLFLTSTTVVGTTAELSHDLLSAVGGGGGGQNNKDAAPPPNRNVLLGVPVYTNVSLVAGTLLALHGGMTCYEVRETARRTGAPSLESACDTARRPIVTLFPRPAAAAAVAADESSPPSTLLDGSILPYHGRGKRLINISNARIVSRNLEQSDVLLVGGNAAVTATREQVLLSSRSSPQQQQQQQQGESQMWSSRVDGTVHCCSFNNYNMRQGSPVFQPLAEVLSYGGFATSGPLAQLSRQFGVNAAPFYQPCPLSASPSMSESVSIVPLCSAFQLRLRNNRLLDAYEAVYRKHVTLEFEIILQADVDTPAPLAAGKVSLPVSDTARFGPGYAQSAAFTQFKLNKTAIGQGSIEAVPAAAASSSTTASSRPEILSVSPSVALITAGRVRNARNVLVDFTFNTRMDRDASHQVIGRFHPHLLVCRTVPPHSNTSFSNTNNINLVAPILQNQEMVIVKLKQQQQQQQQLAELSSENAGKAQNDGSSDTESTTVLVWYEFSLLVPGRGSGSVSEGLIKGARAAGAFGAFLSGFGGSPMVGMAMNRASAMASVERCQFSMEAPLPFLESPMGWLVGAERGAPQRGAILGNWFVLIVITLLLSVTAFIRVYANRRKHRRWMKRNNVTEEQIRVRRKLLEEQAMDLEREKIVAAMKVSSGGGGTRLINLVQMMLPMSLSLVVGGGEEALKQERQRRQLKMMSKTAQQLRTEEHLLALNEPKLLSFMESCHLSKLPSALVVPASMLMHGSVSSAVALVAVDGATNNEKFLAALCIIFFAGFFAWMAHVLWWQIPAHPWLVYKEIRHPPIFAHRRTRHFSTDDEDAEEDGGADDMDPITRQMFESCDSCHHALQLIRKEENQRVRVKAAKKAAKDKELAEKRSLLQSLQQQKAAREESRRGRGATTTATTAASLPSFSAFTLPGVSWAEADSNLGDDDESGELQRRRTLLRRRSVIGVAKKLAVSCMREYGSWFLRKPRADVLVEKKLLRAQSSLRRSSIISLEGGIENINKNNNDISSSRMLNRASSAPLGREISNTWSSGGGGGVAAAAAASSSLSCRKKSLSNFDKKVAAVAAAAKARAVAAAASAATTLPRRAASSGAVAGHRSGGDDAIGGHNEDAKKTMTKKNSVDKNFLSRTGDVFTPCRGYSLRWYQFAEIVLSTIIAIVVGWTAVLTDCEAATFFLTLLNVAPFLMLLAFWPYTDLPSNVFATLSTVILILMGMTTSLNEVIPIAGLDGVIASMQVVQDLSGTVRSVFDIISLAYTFESWLVVPFLFFWHVVAHEDGPLDRPITWIQAKWTARSEAACRREKDVQRQTEAEAAKKRRRDSGVAVDDQNDDDEELLPALASRTGNNDRSSNYDRFSPPGALPSLSRAGSAIRDVVEHPRFRTLPPVIVSSPARGTSAKRSSTSSFSPVAASRATAAATLPSTVGAFGKTTMRCWDPSYFEERPPLLSPAARPKKLASSSPVAAASHRRPQASSPVSAVAQL